jgi:anti-sigma factor RsiW
VSCIAWEEKIAQYAGGDLAAAEVPAVEEHLRNCVDCAELARGLAGDRGLLRARPVELAAMDFDGMRRQLRGRIVRQRRIRRWAPAVAIAAGLLLAVAVAPKHGKPPVLAPVESAPVESAPVQRALVQHARVESAPFQSAQVRPTIPAIQSPEAPPRPRPRRRIETASATQVAMRITTADPDVIIILVPPTTENPHE